MSRWGVLFNVFGQLILEGDHLLLLLLQVLPWRPHRQGQEVAGHRGVARGDAQVKLAHTSGHEVLYQWLSPYNKHFRCLTQENITVGVPQDRLAGVFLWKLDLRGRLLCCSICVGFLDIGADLIGAAPSVVGLCQEPCNDNLKKPLTKRCWTNLNPSLLVDFLGVVPGATGSDVPQQVHHLVLDQAEAHGHQRHACEYVGWTRTQWYVFGLLAGEEVAESYGAQAGEAEVAPFQQGPVLQSVEQQSPGTNVGQHYDQTQKHRHTYRIGTGTVGGLPLGLDAAYFAVQLPKAPGQQVPGGWQVQQHQRNADQGVDDGHQFPPRRPGRHRPITCNKIN